METRIYSQRPKSFKMGRNSPFASKLRKLISDELCRFVGNHTDDVLAEYITVLVCNGKNQDQARDDLEAFLGKRSRDFVSWLWSLLLKYEDQLSSHSVMSGHRDEYTMSPRDKDVDDNGTAKTERDIYNQRSCIKDSSVVKDVCRPMADMSKSVKGVLLREPLSSVSDEAMRKIDSSHNLTDHTEDKLVNVSSENIPLITSRYEKSPVSIQKISEVDCTILPNLHASSLRGDGAPRGPCPMLPETSYTRELADTISHAPVAPVSVSNENNKPRLSVWDRLGKPAAPSSDMISDASGKVDNQSLSALQVPCKRHASRGIQKLREEHADDGILKISSVSQDGSMKNRVPAINNIRRKRHFSNVSSGWEVGSPTRNEMYSSCEKRSGAFKRSTSEAEKTRKQMQDMKLRVRQMEIQMSEMRSKQLGMEKDKRAILLSTSGVLKPTEGDIESRTVFVTNVHFAATKESISSYFSGCGAIVDIVLSTEGASRCAQRSACITFACRESVDKAQALSGSSFHSRTIKVLKEGEKVTMSSQCVQQTGKPLKPQSSCVGKDVTSERPYNACLQWRRETVTTAATVLSESTNTRKERKKGDKTSANLQLPSVDGNAG